MVRTVLLACLLFAAPPAPAVASEDALAAGPAESALAGALSVDLRVDGPRVAVLVWTLMNEGTAVATVELPALLSVSVSGGAGEQRLQARRIDAVSSGDATGRTVIEPGRFVRARYVVDLPLIEGPLVFRSAGAGIALAAVADIPAVPGALSRADPVPKPAVVVAGLAEPPAHGAPPGTAGRATAPAMPRMTDRLGSAISAHEPTYIAFGARDRHSVRFQISFRFRFFNEDGDFARQLVPLRHLYFGYTQTALWDLDTDSAPFRDSSYRPSVFYRNEAIWRSAAGDVRLGLAAGLEHESNGRDGLSSRSINTAFVRPLLRFGEPGGWQLTLGPRLNAYLDRDGNPDIARYRGHVDLFASIGHPDRWQFATTLRRGTGNDAGSAQIEASYPLRAVSLGNLDGYVFFQYFNGYGESLLDYNRRLPAQFRAGFAITRWP
jgi:outer membrane phospholipase A